MKMEEKDKLKEIISLKSQFLFEEFNYEKKLLWGIISLGIAISIYFYKNNEINWLPIFILSIFISSFYELFVFIKMQERVNSLKKEINQEKIKDLNLQEDWTKNILKYFWEKSSKKGKIQLILKGLIIIVLIIWALFPLILKSSLIIKLVQFH